MNKEDLKTKIIEANNSYRNGTPIMSDFDFDSLLEEFERISDEKEYNSFRNSLHEGLVQFGTKLKHKFIMGSLDKIKNSDIDALSKYINKYVKTLLNISAKVDGISSVAHYRDGKLVSFASRGDGYSGMDYTDKSPFVKGLLKEIPSIEDLYIRGELVILNSEDVHSTTNLRNICTGYMNSKTWDKEDISKVSFIPYTILGDKYTKKQQFELIERLGFTSAWHESIDVKEVDNLAETLTDKAKLWHDYSCDGLVLIDDNDYNEIDLYRPKNSMAFKINELVATTKIIDIDFSSVSKDGFICPVFIVEPVEIGGSVIVRASASNLDVIEKLGAKYGSIVEIVKANDIIPHISKVLDNSNTTEIKLPTECPCCGSKLIREDLNLRCINKECKDQVITQIVAFIKKLGCKHSSNATLDNFNIHSFNDLLAFKPNPKYKSEMKLHDELAAKVFNKSKKDLLAATNFVGLSEILINKIVNYYGFENIENSNYVGLPSGVGEITLQKFKDGIQANLELVNRIINDPRYSYKESDNNVNEKIEIIGSVCFTGPLNTMSRNEACKKAQKVGYEIKSGVSKGLTYLVTNTPDSGSSKNKKAKEFGTKVITEEEFIKLVSNQVEEVDLFDL